MKAKGDKSFSEIWIAKCNYSLVAMLFGRIVWAPSRRLGLRSESSYSLAKKNPFFADRIEGPFQPDPANRAIETRGLAI